MVAIIAHFQEEPLNVFGRTPDAGGLQNWINQIANPAVSGITRGSVMQEMLLSAAAPGNSDGVRLANQADFGVQSILDGVPTATATAQLANITADTATVTAAQQTIAAVVTPGTTFALTANADTKFGTAGNDTFTATASTLTAGDVIADSSTGDSDTLTVAVAAGTAAAGSATATVVGIENTTFNFSSFAAPTATITGISAGTVTVNQTQVAGATGATVVGAGNVTVVAGTGVTGTFTVGTTSSTTINAVDAARVDVTGITATGVTIVADSSTTTMNLDATATVLTTDMATISGAGTIALDNEVTLTQIVENLTLSGNGAAVTYDLADAGTAANTIKTMTLTGSQNVTVIASAAAAAAATSITDSTTAGTTTLKLDTAATSNLSKVNVDLIELAAAAGASTYTFRDGQAFKITTANTGAVALDINDNSASTTLTGSLSVDLGVALDATGLSVDATASSDNITALTLTNSTAAQSFALIAGTAVDVTVAGTKALTLANTSTAKSISASGLSGVLTVNYDGTSDIATVTGGSAADIFTMSAATTAATMNGGAGNDTFTTVTLAVATIDGGEGTADRVKVVGDMDSLTISNVEVMELTGAVTSAKLSQLSGEDYIVTGASAFAFGTTAANLDTSTIDLSKLVIDTSAAPTSFTVDVSGGLNPATYTSVTGVTFTGSTITDMVTGTANADTISTGNGADTIIGGAGNDTITAGEGIDSITGGTGADIINLTETTSAMDTINYTTTTDGSAVGVAAGTFSGYDVITGFVLDKDVIDTSTALLALVGDNQVIAQDGATTASNDLADVDFTNVNKIVAFLNDGGYTDPSAATASTSVVAITFSNFTAIYAIDNNTTTAVIAGEVTLLGTVDAILTATELI